MTGGLPFFGGPGNNYSSHAIAEVVMKLRGVGASGMGLYHGVEGFRNFSHARAVYRQSPIDVAKLIRPPWRG